MFISLSHTLCHSRILYSHFAESRCLLHRFNMTLLQNHSVMTLKSQCESSNIFSNVHKMPSHSTLHLETITTAQFVKKLSGFHGIKGFITGFTRAPGRNGKLARYITHAHTLFLYGALLYYRLNYSAKSFLLFTFPDYTCIFISLPFTL